MQKNNVSYYKGKVESVSCDGDYVKDELSINDKNHQVLNFQLDTKYSKQTVKKHLKYIDTISQVTNTVPREVKLYMVDAICGTYHAFTYEHKDDNYVVVDYKVNHICQEQDTYGGGINSVTGKATTEITDYLPFTYYYTDKYGHILSHNIVIKSYILQSDNKLSNYEKFIQLLQLSFMRDDTGVNNPRKITTNKIEQIYDISRLRHHIGNAFHFNLAISIIYNDNKLYVAYNDKNYDISTCELHFETVSTDSFEQLMRILICAAYGGR